mgnify:CR=1 FL=1
MARQAIYTGNSGFDLPSHQLLSNPSQYRNTTWKLCRSPLLERRNPPIERHPPFSPEFIRHLPYPDDKLLANPVTHHHLPIILIFPKMSLVFITRDSTRYPLNRLFVLLRFHILSQKKSFLRFLKSMKNYPKQSNTGNGVL